MANQFFIFFVLHIQQILKLMLNVWWTSQKVTMDHHQIPIDLGNQLSHRQIDTIKRYTIIAICPPLAKTRTKKTKEKKQKKKKVEGQENLICIRTQSGTKGKIDTQGEKRYKYTLATRFQEGQQQVVRNQCPNTLTLR